MTTITASVVVASGSATLFERTLLRTASLLDAYAVARVARRADHARHHQIFAQMTYASERADAQASGSLGLLPR